MNNLIDERSYQNVMYTRMAAHGFETVNSGHSTDGYTQYILFEHKPSIPAVGYDKALGQALKYLVKFNRLGIPVPSTIVLVSQQEEKCYIFNAERFEDIINDIETYDVGRASKSIDSSCIPGNYMDGMITKSYHLDVENPENDEFDELITELNRRRYKKNIRVNINIHNVVGWAKYYYDTCRNSGNKAWRKMDTKDKMFEQLRNPITVLSGLIKAWSGNNEEFSSVMDQLNDMETQHITGAYYTPDAYATLADQMLYDKIKEFEDKYPDRDYLVIDRTAGTGNLEVNLDDDVLSHFIVNTLEYQEWIALNQNIGNKVRAIIPNPAAGTPARNGQTMIGSDATSEEFNMILLKTIDEVKLTDDVGIIFFENNPYCQSGTANVSGASFINSFIGKKMQAAGYGSFKNDIYNQLIYSAFDYMTYPDDAAIQFGPIKPWKNDGFIKKVCRKCYFTNRRHYHANGDSNNPIIWWENTDSDSEVIIGDAYDINNTGALVLSKENIVIRKAHLTFAEAGYDKRKYEPITPKAIVVNKQGNENLEGIKTRRVANPICGNDILGYMDSHSMILNNPGQTTKITIAAQFDGNGFYLNKDNYLSKLPMFAAGRYQGETGMWYDDIYSRTGDGYTVFNERLENEDVKNWLYKVLIWTCMTKEVHMYSLDGSDGRRYLNQLCFRQNTVADETLDNAIANGFQMNETEIKLFELWDRILAAVRETDEYNPEFNYGTHMISKEICIVDTIANDAGEEQRIPRHQDITNLINEFEKKLNKYYIDEIAPKLFEYEFLK